MEDDIIVSLFESIRALEQQLADAKKKIEELEKQIERNQILEEVAIEIEKFKGDTAASFAIFVRNMKQ